MTNTMMIELEVKSMARRIGATDAMLPMFGSEGEESQPFILQDGVDHPTYHYIVKERGVELEHRKTLNKDQILYWTLSYICTCIANSTFRIDQVEVDPRRLYFARIEELLGFLNPDWRVRKQGEHSDILYSHPFDDNVRKRTRLIVELRTNGMSPEQAYSVAVEKYPLPPLVR